MHKNTSQVLATVPLPSTLKTVEIECEEKTGASPPPLPSPPTQQGDAVFSPSQDSPSTISNSLPSFNILKSYDSPSLPLPLVPVSPCSESGGSSEGSHSPYVGHSVPSLSPPLSPPVQDYQDHSQNYQAFSSHPSFNRTHSYSFSTVRNGSESATQGWGKDYPPQEHDHHDYHLHQHYHQTEHIHHPSYGHQEHGQGRKTFFDYQNYYGLQSYGSLHYYPQKEQEYNLTKEQEEAEEMKRKKV